MTLSQTLGTKDIQAIFDCVFYKGIPPPTKDAYGATSQDKGESKKLMSGPFKMSHHPPIDGQMPC